MGLTNRNIVSKASGLTGKISGIERNNLKITFTGFQDVTIPLNRAEELLKMDSETLDELHQEIKKRKITLFTPKESKVETYMDNFEEEIEEIEEQPPVEMAFDDVE
jgi:predicted HTH domain antitoxin